MTGADLPNASRRADGLATSAALRTKLQTNTRKLSQAIPTDAAMISKETNLPLSPQRKGRERAKQCSRGMPDVPTSFLRKQESRGEGNG